MVGRAALELATSFDVGYKNTCILHLLDRKRNKIVQFCKRLKSIDINNL